MLSANTMNPNILKPSRSRRAASPSRAQNHYSQNPIIDRFLQLTIEEGHSVRGVSLCHCPDAAKTVVFSLGDGTNRTLLAGQDDGSFITWWKDTSDFVRRLRNIDLSPSF